MSAMRELEQEPNMPAAHIAMLTGARGPTRSCLTACAASTQAAGEATMLIRNIRRYNLNYTAAQAKIDELMA